MDSHEDARLEAHRAIARETHISTQRAYAFGGLGAVLVVALLMLFAWWSGHLTSPVPYVLSIMLFFVTLFFAKRAIDTHLFKLASRLDAYCQSNNIEFNVMIHYFADRDYTMLTALLDRRAQKSSS